MSTAFTAGNGVTVTTSRSALDQARASLQAAPQDPQQLPYGSLWPVVAVVGSLLSFTPAEALSCLCTGSQVTPDGPVEHCVQQGAAHSLVLVAVHGLTAMYCSRWAAPASLSPALPGGVTETCGLMHLLSTLPVPGP